MIGKLSGSALALVLILVAPALSQDAGVLCSTLAASPYDPSTPAGEGKQIEDIDPLPAIEACQKAVDDNPDIARMHFQLGRSLDASEEYKKALAEYGTAAEMGFALADVALGSLYELGLGVKANADQAVAYYRKAFDQAGLPIAAANLGYVYDHGIGVDVDKSEAAKFFMLASDAGIAWASTSLGYLYETGAGVEADPNKAVKLYQIAAAAGDADGTNNLASAYERGDGGLPQSFSKAAELYKTAVEGGSGLAMANLGNLYAYGRGVAKDTDKAEELFRSAIKSSDPYAVARAQNDLAWGFALTKSNLEEAEQLATAAVEYDADDPITLDTLGWIKHLRGDNEAALELLSKAAQVKPATSQLAHLGAVQQAMGQNVEAYASYSAALDAVSDEFDDATVDLKAIKDWLQAN